MDINVSGRNATITDRFREYTTEKVSKVSQLLPRALVLTVKLSQHSKTHEAKSQGARVEITVRGPGGVIRSEAEGPDKYRAFDQAYHRVMERARRLHDKRTDHRNRHKSSLNEAAGKAFADHGVEPAPSETIERVANGEAVDTSTAPFEEEEWSPVVIREKRFPEVALTPRDAIDQMELVGHPFYLFKNADTGEINVVYRRKGWSYGVISLGETE